MESRLARMWWAMALRGMLAIIFGILAFMWPGAFWLAVVITFAAYAFVDGVFAIVAAVRGTTTAPRWALVLYGVVGIATAAVAIAWPAITELVLLWVIAGWALVTGALTVAAAVQFRKEIRGEWLLGLSGLLSIILGIGLALLPGPGLVVIAWWVGANAIALGIVQLVLGFRLRNLAREPAAAHAMS
jgi:uncharacterized membrane protein HdeD (DUF308 family)